MAEHGRDGQSEVHEAMVPGACPTCDGALHTRTTRAGIRAWCRTCLRLSRPVVMTGPTGPMLVHLAAAA